MDVKSLMGCRMRLESSMVGGRMERQADVAQPEEQRFRKPQVKGSSPFIGSIFEPVRKGLPAVRCLLIRKP